MPELVKDCPRCNAKHTTFDVYSSHFVGTVPGLGWRARAEAFCVCRNCERATIFLVENKRPETQARIRDGLHALKGNISSVIDVSGFVSQKDADAEPGPDHLPEDIKNAWNEGASCLAVRCPNAAASMFRLCIDHATKGYMPSDDVEGLNSKIRRSLGLRLKWLFDTRRLPGELRELSEAIKEDGNDGAHDGTLSMDDAEDIQDFTYVLLERLYTEPEKLKIAAIRRRERRAPE